ncbi:DNRLRE domain-containing protein [Candidatus Bipolaricaulota sp. J31]
MVVLWGSALWGQSDPCADGISPDVQCYVDNQNPDDFFTTPPFYAAAKCGGRGQGCKIKRSYLHFSGDALPTCIGGATLWLKVESVRGAPKIEVREASWDGSHINWNTQPPAGSSLDSKRLTAPGWVSLDVTEAVKRYVNKETDKLAFAIKIYDESRHGLKEIGFSEACLKVNPCIGVIVRGLNDFTVDGKFLSANRYAPLGTLEVEISALVNYRVRICYDVEPTPNPQFTADPVELEYPSENWFTVPRCPVYTELPGFSGSPGTEERTYRVRIDLGDLGDRASGEKFDFILKVEVIPQ